MPDITLEDGQIVKNFPDNPSQEDYAKLERIKRKYSPPPSPQVSPVESAIRGGAQGLSMGFADEATARLESILKGVPYEQALQESRAAYKQAQEANPITYTGSEIVGGVLPAFVPGGVIAKAGQLVSKIPLAGRAIQSLSAMSPLAKGVALGGTTGSVAGLGMSEGQDIGEIARDVGIGGALGGALPVVGRGIAKGIESIPQATSTVLKKGLQGGLGVSSELLTEAEKNPKAVEKILKVYAGENIKKDLIPAKANVVESFMSDNPIAKRAIKNSKLAVDSIPEITEINKNLAINALKDQITILEKSKGVSDVRNQAIKMLDDKIKVFDALPENIKGSELKPILQGLDDDIAAAGGWQNPLKNNQYRDGLENARAAMDRDLKTQVPEYRRLMKKVSEDYQLSNNLTKRFATEKGFDENKIANTLNSQLRKTDTNLQKDFERLGAYGKAGGFENELKLNEFLNDMALKRDIEAYGGKGSSISNRLTGLFTMAGSSIGGLPGGAIGTGLGTIAGSEVEKRGGQMALKTLKAFEPITKATIPEAVTRPIRSVATQQGIQRGLLDQFLSENRSEVERRQAMKSKFEQDNRNRVK
jgi:hypothetical protein